MTFSTYNLVYYSVESINVKTPPQSQKIFIKGRNLGSGTKPNFACLLNILCGHWPPKIIKSISIQIFHMPLWRLHWPHSAPTARLQEFVWCRFRARNSRTTRLLAASRLVRVWIAEARRGLTSNRQHSAFRAPTFVSAPPLRSRSTSATSPLPLRRRPRVRQVRTVRW